MKLTPRRGERQLTREDAIEILKNAEHGTLALHSCDEFPYCVPMNFVLVGDRIYFHCAKEGKKLDCIKKSSKAMFCAIGRAIPMPEKFSFNYADAMAFGEISICEDESERVAALTALVDKYSPQFAQEGRQYIARAAQKTEVLRLDINAISAKGRPAPSV